MIFKTKQLLIITGVLLTLIFPVLVPWFFLDLNSRITEQENVDTAKSSLEQDWSKLQFRSDPVELLTRLFHKMLGRLREKNFGNCEGLVIPKHFFQLFKLQAAWFDNAGKLHFFQGSRKDGSYALKRLWKDLQTKTTTSQKMYWGIFGHSFFINRLLRDKGIPIHVRKNGEPGIFLWRSDAKGRGIVMYCEKLPSQFDTLKSLLSGTTRSRFHAAFDPSQSKTWLHGPQPPDWRKVLQKALITDKTYFLGVSHLFYFKRHPEGFYFLSGVDATSFWKTGQRQVFAGLAIILLLVAIGRAIFRKSLPILSWRIENRLTSMFIILGLIPFGFLFALSHQAFQQRLTAAQNQIHVENVEKMRKLESDYQYYLNQKLKRVRNMSARILSGKNLKTWESRRVSLRDNGLVSSMEAWKASGKLVWDGQTLADQGFVETFARLISYRFLNFTPPELAGWVGNLVKQVILSPTLGFPWIFDRPNQFNELIQNGMGMVVFFDFRKNPVDGIPDILTLTIQPENLRDQILKKMARGETFIYDDNSKRFILRSPDFRKEIEETMRESLQSKKTIMKTFPWKNEMILTTVFPSAQTPEVLFIRTGSLKQVFREITWWKRSLLFGMVLMVLLVVSLTRIFSKSLHRPLREISAGARMFQLGRLDYRLPALGRDELGKLASSFNDMMGEFEKIRVGRELQRNFMPRMPIDIPNFEVAFFNKPSFDLGGDFCDVLPMPDGKWFLAQGDVSGHGIGSALVTAAVKAICQESVAEGCNLETLVLRLNDVVFNFFHRVRMMTFWCGILDPNEKKLEWACLGHIYPLLKTPGAGTQEMKMPMFPVGVRKLKSIKTICTMIPLNAKFMIYTDGFIESRSKTEELFGFERMSQTFSKGHSAQNSLERVLQAHDEFVEGVPPDDDLTILIFRRKE